MECTHRYTFAGIRYKDTGTRIHGSHETVIKYYKYYFCNGCTHKVYVRISHTTGSNDRIAFNAEACAAFTEEDEVL